MLDCFAIQNSLTIDDTHYESSDVIFAIGIKPRHFCGLSADQRASGILARSRHAFHDRYYDVWIEPARGNVIHEKQRPSALNQDVVDAVIDEVGADGVVAIHH